jgi:hypothetical protein
MRLCVIGNSHVGMLRAAARDLGDDGPEITFFAKAGAGIENARVRGSVIAATDRELRAAQARFGMPEKVDVAGYDATILVAGTASIYSALRILQACRVSGWPSCRAAPENVGPRDPRSPARALVSEPAFVAALTDHARAGASFRFAGAFRRASNVPIFLVPQPYPSERVFESTRPRDYGFLRARGNGDGGAISACLNRAIDRAFGEIGNVAVLHQPADTIAHGFTTARAFTRDAVRVDGDTAQHAADLLHVGPAYGKRVLAGVIAGLQAGIAA